MTGFCATQIQILNTTLHQETTNIISRTARTQNVTVNNMEQQKYTQVHNNEHPQKLYSLRIINKSETGKLQQKLLQRNLGKMLVMMLNVS